MNYPPDILHQAHDLMQRLEHTSNSENKLNILAHALNDKKLYEEILRIAVAGTWGSDRHDIFQLVLQNVSALLNVDTAAIAELSGKEQLHIFALWQYNTYNQTDIYYPWENSACEQVLKHGQLYIANDVLQQYPVMKTLCPTAVSYWGIKLIDKQQKNIGLLFITNSQPIVNDIKNEYFFRLFAAQASVELERRVSENIQKQAYQSIAQANQAKSEFLANMSHEIRTPLNAIIGFCEILREKHQNDMASASYLQGINKAANSLLSLINDILDLSKIEAQKIQIQAEFFDLNVLFNEIYQIFWLKTKEKSIDFNIVVPDQHNILCLIDHTRIRQVLFNLVGNAVKFTDKGSISIALTYKPATQPNCYNIQISVTDTGIGIPDELHDVIFEPFYQQYGNHSSKYGGTGLGLAISKRLIEMMNGTITLKSEVGKGSAFVITLKNIEIQAITIKQPKRTKQATSSVVFKKQNVLLVEDEESNRMVIKGFLQNTNLNIIEAFDGYEAINMVIKHHPDVILMDIQMPQMDGIESTQKIRQLKGLESIPIIAITALALPEQQKKINTIFKDCLYKPLKRQDLIEKLAIYLDHEIQKQQSESNEFALHQTTFTVSSELKDLLLGEITEQYLQIQKAPQITILRQLAQRLIHVGKTYKVPVLQQYGENLHNQTQTFDIGAIVKMIPDLGQIISNLTRQ